MSEVAQIHKILFKSAQHRMAPWGTDGCLQSRMTENVTKKQDETTLLIGQEAHSGEVCQRRNSQSQSGNALI